MTKLINFGLVALLMLSSCEIFEADELNSSNTPSLKGRVEVPLQSDPTNWIITDHSEIYEIGMEGTYEVDSLNIVMVSDKNSKEPIYLGIPSSEEAGNYQVGAKETAIFLALKAYPFIYDTRNKSIMASLKHLVYQLDEVQALEIRIRETIKNHGFLKVDAFKDELKSAMERVIRESGLNFEIEVNKKPPFTNNEPSKTTMVGEPIATMPFTNGIKIEYPTNFYDGDEFNENSNLWEITRSFYNANQMIIGVSLGNYDPTTQQIEYGDKVIGFLSPYGVGSYLDNVYDFTYWVDYTQQSLLISQYGWSAFAEMTLWSSSTRLNLEVREPDIDAMVFVSPSENTAVLLANIIHIFLDGFAKMGGTSKTINGYITFLLNQDIATANIILDAFNEKRYRAVAVEIARSFVQFAQTEVGKALFKKLASPEAFEYFETNIKNVALNITAVTVTADVIGNLTNMVLWESFGYPISFDQAYPPSPPKLVNPFQKERLNNLNSIRLEWEGGDLNGDNLTYDLYVGHSAYNLQLAADNLTESFFDSPLEPNKRYYWKVTASDGTYKTESGLWTFDNGEVSKAGFFIDPRDGQEYKTKSFNGKTWMIENLNYETPLSICNDCNSYGRLYLFQDIAENICPDGWSVPNKDDVEGLDSYLKENDAFEQFEIQRGGAASNEDGRIGFYNQGIIDYFWTEIRAGDLWTLIYSIRNNNDTDIYGVERRQRNYYSCRCIKD